MATISVNVPTIADLPSDWKSTLFGLLTLITTLAVQYFQTGAVTLPVCAGLVVVAIICYLIPAKFKPANKAELVEQIEKIVADMLAKNTAATVADGEALIAQQVLEPVAVTATIGNTIASGALQANAAAQANLGA